MTNADLLILDAPDGPVLRNNDEGIDYPFLTVGGAEAAKRELTLGLTLTGLVGSPAKLDAYLEPSGPSSEGGRVRGDAVLDLAADIHKARRCFNEAVVFAGHESALAIAASHELYRLTRQGTRLMAA